MGSNLVGLRAPLYILRYESVKVELNNILGFQEGGSSVEIPGRPLSGRSVRALHSEILFDQLMGYSFLTN